MRLLHTTELRFEEFFDSNIPNYAILSHRWGSDEVSYQELLAIRRNPFRVALELLKPCLPGLYYVFECLRLFVPNWTLALVLMGALLSHGNYTNFLSFFGTASFLLLACVPAIELARLKQYGSGYAKILACCHYAAGDFKYGPFEWVWIDTCCIDKSSSAELSEAINSMYRWYREARVCYAYFSDVSGNEISAMPHVTDTAPSSALSGTKYGEFGASRWFTRGWTLQELLAPSEVVFLASSWEYLGIRSQMAGEIAAITGISRGYIEHMRSAPRRARIATKLSWAVKRQTSRQEDAAYCLLGLFDTHMPLLYGEDENAFYRLQLELVRSTADESVFVWGLPRHLLKMSLFRHTILIAHAATQYQLENTKDEREFDNIPGITRPPYSITNQGLELSVPQELARKSTFLLPLNCCHWEGDFLTGAYAIRLQRSGSTWERSFSDDWSEDLPSRFDIIDRFPNGLYIVPLEWVWSRESLGRRGSEVIYASLGDFL